MYFNFLLNSDVGFLKDPKFEKFLNGTNSMVMIMPKMRTMMRTMVMAMVTQQW